MKRLIISGAITFIAVNVFAGAALADPTVDRAAQRDQKFEERTVFVTGSLIPQRVKVRRIGTATISPVRIIDRGEIDGSGRQTTPGALINETSVRIIGR